jgi:hypothetical protein
MVKSSLTSGRIAYRGRFVVVTMCIHSAVFITLPFGLDPLNMPFVL